MKKHSMKLISLLFLSITVLAAAQVITSQSSNAPAGSAPTPTLVSTSTPTVIYGSRPTFVPASGNFPDTGNMPVSTPTVPQHHKGKKHHVKQDANRPVTSQSSKPITQTQ